MTGTSQHSAGFVGELSSVGRANVWKCHLGLLGDEEPHVVVLDLGGRVPGHPDPGAGHAGGRVRIHVDTRQSTDG